MVRALPSAIPPKMYRHFALVTVLLTTGIAMFADGENREAAAAQIEAREGQDALWQDAPAELARPPVRIVTQRHRRSVQSGGLDGFDRSFGQPMDKAMSSLSTHTGEVAAGIAQVGYSESYLASIGPEERALLLEGLAQEGMLSPRERERKSAALIVASEARSGKPIANY
jgi:hypothetical protein